VTNIQIQRARPAQTADELAGLTGLLDFLREAIVIKATGLDEETLRRPMVPSGLSLLGIVRHLTYVERWWFAHTFGGLDVEFPWGDTIDPEATWRIDPGESAEDVIDLYRAECERSRAVIEGAAPDQPSARPSIGNGEPFMLRWLVARLIEETARHAGHADILREQVDGSIGE